MEFLRELNNPASYFVGILILIIVGYIRQYKIFAKPEDLAILELRIKKEAEEKFLTKEFYNESKENVNDKFEKLYENIDKIEQQNNRILEILIGKE